MSETIWNAKNSTTVKWHDFGDLFPGHNQRCLVVDIYGNMACCVYDSLLREFHLLTDGLSDFDIRDSVCEIIHEVLHKVEEGKAKSLLESEVLEEIIRHKAEDFSGLYFDAVEYWMPLPPVPVSIASINDLSNESGEVKFLTYKVLDDIEHLITASIAKHLQEKPAQGGAEQ